MVADEAMTTTAETPMVRKAPAERAKVASMMWRQVSHSIRVTELSMEMIISVDQEIGTTSEMTIAVEEVETTDKAVKKDKV